MFSCYIKANVRLRPFIWTLTSSAGIIHLWLYFKSDLRMCFKLRATGKPYICVWYLILTPVSPWSSCLLWGRLPFHVRTPVLQVCCCLFTPVGSWRGRWRAYTISPRLTAGENVYEINIAWCNAQNPALQWPWKPPVLSPLPPPLPLFLSFSIFL